MKLAFLGDIAFVGKFDLLQNRDAKSHFNDVVKFLSEHDYVVGNLESPLTTKSSSLVCKALHVKASPINVELLKYLGVNVVNLSNNHIFDYGVKGFSDSVEVLEQNGIQWFGVNDKRVIIKDESNKIRFSAYTCYSSNASRYKSCCIKNNYVTPLKFKSISQDLTNKDAFNIVSIHWGIEHINYPMDEHRDFVSKLNDFSDFIIYGHHPHVVQGVVDNKDINNSLVTYSLGNFCFDQLTSKHIKGLKTHLDDNNRKSYILSVEIIDNKIVNIKRVDIYESSNGDILIGNNPDFEDYNRSLNLPKEDYNTLFRSKARKSPTRSFKWLLSRLNYYFIGAFLKGQRNSRKFKKEFKGND